MATIDQVRKQYDKLTPPERFALMVAAGARGDKSERSALAGGAPTVTFEFPNVIGLSQGFEALTVHHAIQQLGTAGALFQLIYLGTGDEPIQGESGETYNQGDVITLTARRFMEGREAFNAVCEEYKIDPEVMRGLYLSGYEMTLAFAELVIKSAFALSPVELESLEGTKQAYRQLIETNREHWAEAQARR
jgi:hypothetical protein